MTLDGINIGNFPKIPKKKIKLMHKKRTKRLSLLCLLTELNGVLRSYTCIGLKEKEKKSTANRANDTRQLLQTILNQISK